ncbi:Bug family tripartite tricarboxylate transporter substrate binding protein [Haladaptatus pallidirubidus]|uniref:Tripartite tricarboxylate transporter substrate binding protein n=1 Tax=Haladaptatus pallidirubidus TaxID=1008152 RepID=A0AAV3UGU9_9EURY|nr:tripartite tricarboxylate transporter substrate binding protein [Haladaptatus pallidirubidus]
MVGNQSPLRVENEEPRKHTSVRRRNFIKAVSGVGVVGTAGCLDKLSEGSGQNWPSGQVEIVVPWAAGGGSDRTSRAVADAAEKNTEVSWNVKNQTGGSGSVGMSSVANSQPNGLTLGCTAPEICLFEHLEIAELSPKDLTPIMQYTQMPATIVVHENSKYKSLDEFLSFAKSNPGKIKMANSGTGSSWHMAGAAFVSEAGINVQHVPYDGAKPAITATLNGETDCATVGAVEVAPQVRDGPLKSLGVMYDEKLDSLPQTPTMKQQGVDIVIGSWLAHFGPKDLPEDVRDSIVETYNTVYEDQQFKKFMENNNFLRVKRGPDELKKFLDQKYKYYGKLVKELNINK